MYLKKIIGIFIMMLLITTILPISAKFNTVDLEIKVKSNNVNSGWYKTYGGDGLDCFKGLDLTNDGGYILAGETEIEGSKEAWLVKTDSDGNVLWELTYGTTNGRDALWPVKTTSDGGYICGGWFYNITQETWDGLLIKVDENGNILWVNTYGGDGNDQFYALLEVDDGYFAVGRSSSYTPGKNNGFIMKTDFYGNMIWVKALEKEGYSGEVDGITVANEGDGYIISGGHYSETEPTQGRLLKIDEEGNILWDKSYGSDSRFDWCISVTKTSDENYIVAGGTNGGPYGQGKWGPDIWILKLDNEGNIIWDIQYGIPIFKDYSLCVEPTSDGGFIFTGHTFGIGGIGDATHAPWSKICLVKTDSEGTIEWAKRMPKTGHGRTVQEINDGYIICGFEGPGHGTGSEYGILIKTDENGNIG
jgi:hypothetical protein